ncbi:serine--tRNA ligase [Candidatus Wolfebacteria bacterium RIFOXYD12_FULL_48_21]|uniref:Serine--tRNA ligase n=1 Tax=Candidatus Wolfebacteria bacterium RIFOXYD1_FULL_48_65 TaxID=1802561 RepID=A0A1F8E0A4_9BACT|nr:MAG: serine--tRNA ligase [Candidatus Wolfebacteria bacterium RIFOXYD1_FULL_48_65]OGM94760.1 MAG: serine--tRNA ligase [Candidatus Wolfebacteria bacterium RIFOXYD12_FULL_48_21]OGM95803.1 MAG: serine--tRNA ligase [Candidatus Wolfebacteria bacterium RIFOXYD2_FULL_48_11]
MVDIKYIRDNVEAVKGAIKNKHIDLNLDELLEADKTRVDLQQKVERLSALKNELNERMKTASADERGPIIEEGKKVKEDLLAAEPAYREAKQKFDELMVRVPTVPSSDTPLGASDADNVEIYRWGEPKKFDFEPKDHVQLAQELDIIDFEKGAKVSGYRGYYLKNEGTQLVMALMMYAVNKMAQKGYTPMIPPTLVKGFSLFGSGYFKGMDYDPEVDEIYQIATSDKDAEGATAKDKKFLVGTAEPSLLAYYSDEVLKEEQLPIRLAGYSQCYRSEIGSYGKDTKGMYRVHEFMKVEQVVIAKADAEEANKLQQEMMDISREMHEELGLPYRQIQICAGDMSAGKFRAFDIEAWMPGLNRWGETGSASNFVDWQARRLNVKYVDANGERKYVYMLNNTALPSPRSFIAVLENYQQADGSIVIPEVLQKYTGFAKIERRK